MVGLCGICYICSMNELVSASEVKAPSRLAQMRGGMRAALRLALDVALPPLCPSCRSPLGDGVGLCADCWSRLYLIEPPYCARLGIPFTYDPGPGLLSMEAIADPPAYDRRAQRCAMTTSPARRCMPSNTATAWIWRR
jgi:double zinc ribbon protein